MQSISDIMTTTLVKAINTKVSAAINDFSERLCSKYDLSQEDILALWNEVMPELKVKQKKSASKSKGVVDPSQIKTCKHVPDAGKFKGIECGKRCIGDYCSAHLPEKLEKQKAKREAEKKVKKDSDKSEDEKPKKKAKKEESDDEEDEKPKKKAKKSSSKSKSSACSSQEDSDDDTSDVSDSDEE
jgi:hypothetical protein